jgi:DNA-binding response OmpR family regulator
MHNRTGDLLKVCEEIVINALIKDGALKKSGFKAREFLDLDTFYRTSRAEAPDPIILDAMLPGTDGFEMCKYLKKQDAFAPVPIIMLTVRAEETEKVRGLELGADDYVTKPFSPSELVVRRKAVLSRHGKLESTKKIAVGEILREKLNEAAALVKHIRGLGYKLEE